MFFCFFVMMMGAEFVDNDLVDSGLEPSPVLSLRDVESLWRDYPDLCRQLVAQCSRAIFSVLESCDLLYIRPSLGLDGQPLYIVKLRYLDRDAEYRINSSRHADCPVDDGGSFVHQSWDYIKFLRVFPYWKLVRSLKLDEIPGVVHRLLGDIALVGPRPWLAEELQHHSEYWHALQYWNCKSWLIPPTALWLVPDFPDVADPKERLKLQNLAFAESCSRSSLVFLLRFRLLSLLSSFSYRLTQMSFA